MHQLLGLGIHDGGATHIETVAVVAGAVIAAHHVMQHHLQVWTAQMELHSNVIMRSPGSAEQHCHFCASPSPALSWLNDAKKHSCAAMLCMAHNSLQMGNGAPQAPTGMVQHAAIFHMIELAAHERCAWS